MTERNNLDIVKDSYAAFGRGDLAAVLADLAADVLWTVGGPAHVPGLGSFRGHEGVGRFFAELGDAVESLSFEPGTFFAEGNRVVVLGAEAGRCRRTGQTYTTHWVQVFTFVDGKVAEFREYTDSAAICVAQGISPSR